MLYGDLDLPEEQLRQNEVREQGGRDGLGLLPA